MEVLENLRFLNLVLITSTVIQGSFKISYFSFL